MQHNGVGSLKKTQQLGVLTAALLKAQVVSDDTSSIYRRF
jgi:hypothetical protein